VQGEGAQQRLTPIDSCGIAMVSMGLLIAENQPVIWRGPMLNGIIRQFLYQVEWGERDVLVVDLPPGTGDAQLSLAQAVPMAGVIIVTTPQQVSLQDARRGLAMFLQMGVPVLGVVENMTAFIPPDAPEKRYELFGSGGGQRLAQEARRAPAGPTADGTGRCLGRRPGAAGGDRRAGFDLSPGLQRPGRPFAYLVPVP
jgi:ATP-binding protein involved in chromosome partitioning